MKGGPGGVSDRGVVVLRAALAACLWVFVSAGSLLAGVAAKEACSSDVGSVEVSGSANLL
jgi:hypothetical protein